MLRCLGMSSNYRAIPLERQVFRFTLNKGEILESGPAREVLKLGQDSAALKSRGIKHSTHSSAHPKNHPCNSPTRAL